MHYSTRYDTDTESHVPDTEGDRYDFAEETGGHVTESDGGMSTIDFTGQGAPPMLNAWFVWDKQWKGETALRMLDRKDDAAPVVEQLAGEVRPFLAGRQLAGLAAQVALQADTLGQVPRRAGDPREAAAALAQRLRPSECTRSPDRAARLLDPGTRQRPDVTRRVPFDPRVAIDLPATAVGVSEGYTVDLSTCPSGWSNTEGLTDTEIKAMYAYLVTLPPVAVGSR